MSCLIIITRFDSGTKSALASAPGTPGITKELPAAAPLFLILFLFLILDLNPLVFTEGFCRSKGKLNAHQAVIRIDR